MSVYKAFGKGKKVVKVKLMQPCYYIGSLWTQRTVPLSDLLDVSQVYADNTWDAPAWKKVDGIDMNLYFSRKKDLKEIIDVMYDTEHHPDNYYFNAIQEYWNKILKIGSELNRIYTDISSKHKRCKIFQKYEAPTIEVDN